ncbi:hypothetical protein HMPREF9098_0233 [Kingella denitrificans ATCC 33394]|uniref:Uncharacterized protein n=1 Tax=Kingella denitrificans ATCC 33394 TaxID=888741 RepID=F0EWJ7_9NEIS|nr:hypothetical protein HMPREF9098_0233 [Kingella denitrificans ATCC 33394]
MKQVQAAFEGVGAVFRQPATRLHGRTQHCPTESACGKQSIEERMQ